MKKVLLPRGLVSLEDFSAHFGAGNINQVCKCWDRTIYSFQNSILNRCYSASGKERNSGCKKINRLLSCNS